MTAFGTLLVSKTNRVEENTSSNRNYTKDTGENLDDESDNDEKKKKQIRKRKLEKQIQHERTKKKSKV